MRWHLLTLMTACLLGAAAVQAQTGKAPAPKPPPAAAQDGGSPGGQPSKAGWASRCVSSTRKADLECSVEQSAVLKTGQIVVQFSVAIPAPGKPPVAFVQLPLGIFLPAGVRVEVDEGKTLTWPIQTCDQRGCFATAPLPADFLAAMQTGKTLTVSFNTNAKERASIPLQLADFAEAYARIE